jgi:2-oxo-3-hexenedioate decarboxylase
MNATAAIAAEMLDALDHGRIIGSVVERHPGLDWDEGYGVAAEIVKLRRARGEQTVGRKIGFTNRNIWPEYGATAPIWAHVYENTLIHARDHAATMSLAGSVQPRIEPEIAFKLCAPLPADCNDPEMILQSLEWLAPSFEIVDCHFPDWKFKPADAAVDFSFHWRLIIGTPYVIRKNEIAALVTQLRDCQVILRRDGTIMDRGVGANALGHPALALAFLGGILARQPQFDPLTAGELVTTGTLTAALPVAPGETWNTDYGDLPISGLAVRFTA